MTEDEARQKWCPMARTVFGYDGGTTQPFNRFIGPPDDVEVMKVITAIRDGGGAKCIASGCACWVWDEQLFNPKTGRFLEPGDQYLSTDGVYSKYRETDGHCGLIHK